MLGILLNLKQEGLEFHQHLAQFFIQFLHALLQLEWTPQTPNYYMWISVSPICHHPTQFLFQVYPQCLLQVLVKKENALLGILLQQQLSELKKPQRQVLKTKLNKTNQYLSEQFFPCLLHIKWKQRWSEFSAWTSIKNPYQAKMVTE